jgi:hypothetical protein
VSPAPDNVEAHPLHAANNVNGIGISSIVDYQVLPLDPRVKALEGVVSDGTGLFTGGPTSPGSRSV